MSQLRSVQYIPCTAADLGKLRPLSCTQASASHNSSLSAIQHLVLKCRFNKDHDTCTLDTSLHPCSGITDLDECEASSSCKVVHTCMQSCTHCLKCLDATRMIAQLPAMLRTLEATGGDHVQFFKVSIKCALPDLRSCPNPVNLGLLCMASKPTIAVAEQCITYKCRLNFHLTAIVTFHALFPCRVSAYPQLWV